MAFHHACYEKKFGRTAKKAVSKKLGFTCQVCFQPIERGDFFTWTRRTNGHTGQASQQENQNPPNSDSQQQEAPPPSETETKSTKQEESTQGQGGEAPALNLITDKGLLPAGEFGKAITPMVAKAVQGSLEARLNAFQEKTIAEAKKAFAEHANTDIPVKVTHVVLSTPKEEGFSSAGIQHAQFPTLLKFIQSGCNVWLCGPAGSGKTRATLEVAKALGKAFYFTGAVGDQYGLSGYMNAEGTYVPSNFFKAFTTGGVFLWDEVDASDQSALLWANAAIENGHCAFPHGIFERHPECIIVAAANTWGHGATHEYVGRTKQDAAFLDRFAQLAWGYDEALETHLATHKSWAKRVQQVRKRVTDKGIRVLVTPRSTLYGDKLLAAGLSQDEVELATLRKGMTPDQWNQVK